MTDPKDIPPWVWNLLVSVEQYRLEHLTDAFNKVLNEVPEDVGAIVNIMLTQQGFNTNSTPPVSTVPDNNAMPVKNAVPDNAKIIVNMLQPTEFYTPDVVTDMIKAQIANGENVGTFHNLLNGEPVVTWYVR